MIQRKKIDKDKALGRLCGLCGRSEQCELDLIRKMINWGLSATDRNEIIEYLKENRYLDNSRFARSYANDKARFASWGPIKIRMELARRRIPSSEIKEALERVESEVWKKALLHNAEIKAKNLDLIGEESRKAGEKLYKYLISRGFSSSSSSKAVTYMRKKQEEGK